MVVVLYVYTNTHQGDMVVIQDGMESYYKTGNDGTVESWNGPLMCYNMKGWRPVTGGFLRPRPVCPARGMAIREQSSKFEWRPGMKELITKLLGHHTASTAPCEHIAEKVKMDGRWEDLFCPSKTQVKNFILAHFSRQKKQAEHAVAREGKRSYSGFSLKWLQAEVKHRGLTVGRRKVAGCVALLEQDDDEHDNLPKYHRATDYESVPTRLGFTEFRKHIESCSERLAKKIPWEEWYRKECAYQDIAISARKREAGMCKLLHTHYLDQPGGVVHRHDEDHNVDVACAHARGDRVEVFWKGQWYPATVTKCHCNNTWDVKYPLEEDVTFCTRLPAGLLREANDSIKCY